MADQPPRRPTPSCLRVQVGRNSIPRTYSEDQEKVLEESSDQSTKDESWSSEESTPRNSSVTEEDVRQAFKKVEVKIGSGEDVPYHVFSRPVKMAVVAMVSSAALLSGLSSNIYFPAQDEIAKELSMDENLVNASITTYLIAQGLAPSFWGPLADMFGRRPVLIATLLLYITANVVLAFVQNSGMLLAFRALQAAGSSSTISLGAGVIADITTPAERGGYLGVFSGARQFSIALGPVFGGLLAQYLGFRSIFWFLVILSSVTTILIILLLPETLRRISGNGSVVPRQHLYRPLITSLMGKNVYLAKAYRERQDDLETACQGELRKGPEFKWSMFLQPFLMLFEKDVACALFFGAAAYTAWSMMTATTTVILGDIYGFSTLEIGLCFLANGVGCIAGSTISGKQLNNNFRRETSLYHFENGSPRGTLLSRPLPVTFPIEKARLSQAPLYTATMIIMFLIFGWSLSPLPSHSTNQVVALGTGHYIAPLLAQFALGYSSTAILNCNNTLVVDLYPGKSASASATVNLSRNLIAAAGVATVGYLLEALGGTKEGCGYLGSIFAGIVLLGFALNLVHGKFGPRWRAEREERLALKKEAAAAAPSS